MASIMDLCIAKGIDKIKLANGTEIYFRDKINQDSYVAVSPEKEIESLIPKDEERMPTDDEMLLYSTDAFDDLRAQREEATLNPSKGN